MILGLLKEKGGAGATTMALNLGHALALDGARVLYIDADPQGTASDWLAARGDDAPSPFRLVQMARPVLHKEMGELRRGYDAVVIDGPPRNADIIRSAIAAASHVIIPVQPSGADLWAARSVVDLIGQAQVFNEALRAAFALSRVIGGTVLGRDFAATLDEYGLPHLPGTMQRVVYAEAMLAASTVFEADPAGPAAAEIRTLLTSIRSL